MREDSLLYCENPRPQKLADFLKTSDVRVKLALRHSSCTQRLD